MRKVVVVDIRGPCNQSSYPFSSVNNAFTFEPSSFVSFWTFTRQGAGCDLYNRYSTGQLYIDFQSRSLNLDPEVMDQTDGLVIGNKNIRIPKNRVVYMCVRCPVSNNR